MRQFGTDGRSRTSGFERGVYNWRVRPGNSGSGGAVRTTTATVSCSGSYYDPVPTTQTFVGTPVALSGGGLKGMNNQTVLISMVASSVTAAFGYVGGTTGYYASGSLTMSLVLYQGPSVFASYPCGLGYLQANPLFYVYSKEGANDHLEFGGIALSPTLSDDIDMVGIDLTLRRLSASLSFKVLMAWQT